MQRNRYFDTIAFHFKIHSVCGLLGPRQVGKTTLAGQFSQQYPTSQILDLENPIHLELLENPMITLSNIHADLIVIDEIQRRPDLFPILRVLVDQKPRRFLVLGSASRDLLQQSSETLAGRIGYIELPPFSITETGEYQTLWLRGGFPRSYLAQTSEESYAWRQSYVATFLERDLPSLGFNIPPAQIRRLWMMLAHNHGNILNLSELGVGLGVTHHTIRQYVEILTGTFMVRVLDPWFENISKRQVKSPKVYIRDSGLINTLLGLKTTNDMLMNPRLGALWEGFALEEIIKIHEARPEECFFWASQSGAELDLLIVKDGKKIGFEIKYTDKPKLTASMHSALQNLKLDHLYVIHPHKETFPLAANVTAQGLMSYVPGKNQP